MREIILKVSNFERGLSKNLKKSNFVFSAEPSPFQLAKLAKTKGDWN